MMAGGSPYFPTFMDLDKTVDATSVGISKDIVCAASEICPVAV